MATCVICNRWVKKAGQECRECFFDQFTTFAQSRESTIDELRRMFDAMNQDLLKAEFEERHPDLYRTLTTTGEH